MHGTIEHPKCLRLFGSIEFLRDMPTLNTREGSANDRKYLYLVANVMGWTIDGELMGDKVRSLKLNIYAKFTSNNLQSLCQSNILDVACLISKCRNLERLDLRLAGIPLDRAPNPQEPVPQSPFLDNFKEQRCGLLGQNGPFHVCMSVLEKVKEFSLVVSTSGFLNLELSLMKIGNTPIQFNRVIYLRLVNCIVDSTSWGIFLDSSRETLTMLHLCDFKRSGQSDQEYSPLPFPLPRLKEVSIHTAVEGEPLIGEVLSQCSELEHVDLRLHLYDRVDDRVMESLSGLLAVRNVEIEQYILGDDDFGMVDNSKFKVVDWFSEKITSFRLWCNLLDHRYIGVLDHAIDICLNLTEFGIGPFDLDGGLRRATASLCRLFQNKERAMRLRKLWIRGDLSHDVLNTIFENCLELELLDIDSCRALNDEHLIWWAERSQASEVVP